MRLRTLPLLVLLSAPLFAADLTGDYTGTSSTDDGSYTSKIHIVLKKTPDAWDCKFSFNIDGEDVVTKTISCTVDDAKFTAEYETEVQGTALHVVLDGGLKEDKSLEGKFKTVAGDGGDANTQGTWKASLKQ